MSVADRILALAAGFNANLVDRRGGLLNQIGLLNGWGSVATQPEVRLADDAAGARVVSFEDIYRSQPVVFALVNTLVRQASRLPWRAYEGDPYGEHTPLPAGHPLQRLLARPAPGCSGFDLKQSLFLPVLIHGNAVLAKYRGDGDQRPPTELLRLDWRAMDAYARRGLPVEKWVSRQVDPLGHELDPSAIIHVCWQPPSGGIGVSPLEALGVTVALEDSVRRYGQASFVNGVRPSGALTLPKDVQTTPEERLEMRADIEKMHRGVDNAFRLALLTGGAEFQPMSFTAQEAALIETRIVNREEFCIAYDVAPPLIGDLGKGSYNNVEELNRQRYKSVLPPWLTLGEETLQAQLIDPEPEWDGLFVRFDLSQVLKGDPSEEAAAQGMLVEKGVITRDEARGRLGLPPIGGNAAELFYPENNQALVAGAGEPPSSSPPV